MAKRFHSAAACGIAAALALVLLVGCTGGGQPTADPEHSRVTTAHPARSAGSSALAPTPAKPASFTVVATGDVLIHPQLTAQARADATGGKRLNFRPLLAGVRPLVRGADLAICHLETPLAPAGGPYEGWPTFAAPPQVLDALRWAGYDTCSTASNHTMDQGFAGIRRTLADLDHAGIAHTGSAATAAAARTPDILDVHGTKVAQLSYTFGLNGLPRPPGKPWAANLIGARRILAAAHRARAAGAQVVIASLHWGVEYHHPPTTDQVSLARRLLASPDIDVIIGCHAHVVQPVAKVHGKWVVYGMGNEVARHADATPENREGLAVRFTFTKRASGWAVTHVEAVPLWMRLSPKLRLVDLATTRHRTPAEQAAYEQVGRIVRSGNGSGSSDEGLSVAGSG